MRNMLVLLFLVNFLYSTLYAEELTQDEILFLQIGNRDYLQNLEHQKRDEAQVAKQFQQLVLRETKPNRSELGQQAAINQLLIDSFFASEKNNKNLTSKLQGEWIDLAVKTTFQSLTYKDFPTPDEFFKTTAKGIIAVIDDGRRTEIKKHFIRAALEQNGVTMQESAEVIGRKLHTPKNKLSPDDFVFYLRSALPSATRDFSSGNRSGAYLECVYRGKEDMGQFIISAKLETLPFSPKPTPAELRLAGLNASFGFGDKVPDILTYLISERLYRSVPKGAHIFGSKWKADEGIFFAFGETDLTQVTGVTISIHSDKGGIREIKLPEAKIQSFKKLISPDQGSMTPQQYNTAIASFYEETAKQSLYFAKILLAKPDTRKVGLNELQNITSLRLPSLSKKSPTYLEIIDLNQKIKKDPKFVPTIVFE